MNFDTRLAVYGLFMFSLGVAAMFYGYKHKPGVLTHVV